MNTKGKIVVIIVAVRSLGATQKGRRQIIGQVCNKLQTQQQIQNLDHNPNPYLTPSKLSSLSGFGGAIARGVSDAAAEMSTGFSNSPVACGTETKVVARE